MALLIWIMFAHFMADFMFQCEKFQYLKSQSVFWLTAHVVTYTFVLWLFLLPTSLGWQFALFNGAFHWMVDAVTSKITSYAYKRKNMWLFWRTIGFDQFLHIAALIYFSGVA